MIAALLVLIKDFLMGFLSIEEALEKVTYSQDKSLVRTSYKRYINYKQQDEAIV